MSSAAFPEDPIGLAAVVLLLGIRHGFDPDHLATIDGLTRAGSRSHPLASRACGLLFSLGHGAVVVAVAVSVAGAAASWQAPSWLEVSGAWVSIAFLLLLGVTNIATVLRAPRHAHLVPVALRHRLLQLVFGRSPSLWSGHPQGSLAVGALFALSFDTLSQAALFTAAATRAGGWPQALGCAFVFTLGMALTGGANGLWISRLLLRSDATARIASRVMGLGVGAASLMMAGLGMARLASSAADAWFEGREALFSMVLIGLVGASFVLAIRLASARGRRPRSAVRLHPR